MLDGAHPCLTDLGSGGDGQGREARVEDRARDDVAVLGGGPADFDPAGRADVDAVDRRVPLDRRLRAQPPQLGDAVGADGVAADLVAGERGLVDQEDACAGPAAQQVECGRAAGRPGTDDQQVVRLRRPRALR
jgi:hypothetical protein